VSKAEPENLRREGRLAAKIEVALVRGRRTIQLETFDVSFKGLFLRTEEPPPVRSLVRLRVKLPGREIEAHAMAVHVAEGTADRGAGVGVQFWGLAGPDRHAWDAFIQELLQAQRAAAKAAAAAGAGAETPPESRQSDNLPSGIRIAPIVDIDATRSVG
jgi:hypothetical protein